MSVQSADNLQLLGGVLIVLSLMLLWCWHKKKYRREGLANRKVTQDHLGGLRFKEGLVNQNVTQDHLTGLRFKEGMDDGKVNSMHDIENLSANRNSRVTTQNKVLQNLTGLRWQTEGMVGIDDTEFDSSHATIEDLQKRALTVGSEIITPEPHLNLPNDNRSLTGAILRLTDTHVNYGNARGYVST